MPGSRRVKRKVEVTKRPYLENRLMSRKRMALLLRGVHRGDTVATN